MYECGGYEIVRIAGGTSVPQVNPAVLRVLDAVRAWRKMTGDYEGSRSCWRPEVIALHNAIDALDAPRERYTVWPGSVHVRDAVTGEVLPVDECARRLNAAERAK